MLSPGVSRDLLHAKARRAFRATRGDRHCEHDACERRVNVALRKPSQRPTPRST